MSGDRIPEYPEFRKVTISDKARMDEIFDRFQTEISERTFASVYAWRNYATRSRLSMFEGHLLISWRRERYGDLLLPPVGPEPAATISKLSSEKPQGFNGFFCLTEPTVTELRRGGLDPESLRDEWDYVYRTQDLAMLAGPAYHTQKKEIRKATSQYQLSFEPMTAEHRDASLQLEELWCNLKSCSADRLSAAEDAALKESLLDFGPLRLVGGVVLIEGRIQALTVGERLNTNTAVVHFEKANPEIRGLYPFISQQFCEKVLAGYEFVNREQDVGEQGLRRAKEGYHPHHFVEKHLLKIG